LISYVFFRLGLALPHIAAGDNLDLPILGGILRSGGAFFIRRTWGDDALYSALAREYIEVSSVFFYTYMQYWMANTLCDRHCWRKVIILNALSKAHAVEQVCHLTTNSNDGSHRVNRRSTNTIVRQAIAAKVWRSEIDSGGIIKWTYQGLHHCANEYRLRQSM
jgi:hypothetical protein